MKYITLTTALLALVLALFSFLRIAAPTDASADFSSKGKAVAGAKFLCSNVSHDPPSSWFNTITSHRPVVKTAFQGGDGPGMCSIDFGFPLTDRLIVVTAMEIGSEAFAGANTWHTVLNATDIRRWNLEIGVQKTPVPFNGLVTIVVY